MFSPRFGAAGSAWSLQVTPFHVVMDAPTATQNCADGQSTEFPVDGALLIAPQACFHSVQPLADCDVPMTRAIDTARAATQATATTTLAAATRRLLT
jgi:hypothetical protein